MFYFLHLESLAWFVMLNIRAVLGSDWREAYLIVYSAAGDSWRLVVFGMIEISFEIWRAVMMDDVAACDWL